MDTTTLGDRMKNFYENRTKQYLARRINTIIRLDGKAFHTYTKGLEKPFDEGLIEDMQEVTKYLCENIQGAKCGYTQSDEITILLTDYDRLDTTAWFDGNVQKITSISAALATAKFNELRFKRSSDSAKLALFDSRVFQIPEKEEVVNCFLWRQRDAEKNSIAMLAQSLYSPTELHKKNGSDMQEMCFQKGHNWNSLHFSKKRGSFIVKNTYVNDELAVVYPEIPKDGGLEYYPKNCREDLTQAICRRYVLHDTFGDTFTDIEINKVRTKWEVIETPYFGKERESILKLI